MQSAPSIPARCIASSWWAAVTPEPQYTPTSLPGFHPQRREPLGQLGDRPEASVGLQVLRGRGAGRARDVSGAGVDRLGLAPVPLARARASSSTPVSGQRRRLVGVHRGGQRAGGRSRKSPDSGALGLPPHREPEAALQAAKPPSSTRTRRWPTPSAASHQARAAAAELAMS